MKNKELFYFDSELSKSKIQVIREDDKVYMSLKSMALMFGVTSRNIGMHTQKILKSGEFNENSVRKDFFLTAEDGKSYNTKHYNHEIILAVGNRVNSALASEFRTWVAELFRQFTVDGYAINKELLKNDSTKVDGLAKITKELRAVEKTLYNKLKFILSNYSIDYDPNSQTAKDFFATCQNIIYYAVTTKTAAEILKSRSNSNSPNMGLQTWANNRLTLSDAETAKNYLIDKELQVLEGLINMFLDYANVQILVNRAHTMQDWLDKLVMLIRLNGFEVLIGKGNISSKLAKEYVKMQYEIFKGKYLA